MTTAGAREYNEIVTEAVSNVCLALFSGRYGDYMKKRKRWPAVILLWLIFISMTGGIFYLSLQSGEQTRELGKSVLEQFSGGQDGNAVSQQELDTLTYLFRQSGRVLAFLMIGIVGTITIHLTCVGCNWLIRTGITLLILTTIACFTEKLKVYIPSRHYSYEEMMLSVAAVAAGFLAVTFITLLGRAMKGITRLITTSHTL